MNLRSVLRSSGLVLLALALHGCGGDSGGKSGDIAGPADTGVETAIDTTSGPETPGTDSFNPASTLLDQGDGSVLDSATGLLWQKASGGPLGWLEAMSYCTHNNPGLPGTKWRLPTVDELRSIIIDCAESVTGGACTLGAGCKSGCPVSCQKCAERGCTLSKSGCYLDNLFVAEGTGKTTEYDCGDLWSGTIVPGKSGSVYAVNFNSAWVYELKDFNTRSVRCVRAAE